MNIKRFRKEQKKTQVSVANDLGVCLKTYQNYEKGLVTIPNKQLKKLAAYFDVSIPTLFNEDTVKTTINLKNIEIDLIADFVVNNWDLMLENKAFHQRVHNLNSI